jgi:hypothetical protein
VVAHPQAVEASGKREFPAAAAAYGKIGSGPGGEFYHRRRDDGSEAASAEKPDFPGPIEDQGNMMPGPAREWRTTGKGG